MGIAFSACLRSAFRQPFNCIAALLHCKLIKFIRVGCFGLVLKQKPAPDNHVASVLTAPKCWSRASRWVLAGTS